jgi:hypothetical protein
MLKYCANRIMALQELQALGRMAAGFERTGCYACDGLATECEFYTPLGWVYEAEKEVPDPVGVFIPDEDLEEEEGE